jgi:hypothetical protein
MELGSGVGFPIIIFFLTWFKLMYYYYAHPSKLLLQLQFLEWRCCYSIGTMLISSPAMLKPHVSATCRRVPGTIHVEISCKQPR